MAGQEIRTCDGCVCWNAEAVCIRVMRYRFAGCAKKITREQENRRPHYTPFRISRGGKMTNAMATNENNVKCEGCIHLGDDGRCWQGVKHRPYCTQRMTLTDAVKIPPVEVTRAAREYVKARNGRAKHYYFDGIDLQGAFEAGAMWRAQHPDK